jgi:phosphate transport system permease protein
MATEAAPQPEALFRRRRPRVGDLALRGLTTVAGALVLAIIVLITYQVANGAWPALQTFGIKFITGTEWNAVTNVFGARYLIWGTLFTSVFSLLIAVPVAIAIGLFLSELAPRRLRTPIGTMVELLAAIPSVVLGLWGIIILGPFLAQHVEPWLSAHLGFIPLFSGYPSNVGLLPACLILTIMVVPIVASISRELFLTVPTDLKQGSMALGSTRWEMVRGVMIPQVSGGLVAAVMLGFGRALGEAIAVVQVIGGTQSFRGVSLFSQSQTMAGQLASQFQGTATSLQKSALFGLALILLIFSLLTNLTAQWIVRRMQRKMEGAR